MRGVPASMTSPSFTSIFQTVPVMCALTVLATGCCSLAMDGSVSGVGRYARCALSRNAYGDGVKRKRVLAGTTHEYVVTPAGHPLMAALPLWFSSPTIAAVALFMVL